MAPNTEILRADLYLRIGAKLEIETIDRNIALVKQKLAEKGGRGDS